MTEFTGSSGPELVHSQKLRLAGRILWALPGKPETPTTGVLRRQRLEGWTPPAHMDEICPLAPPTDNIEPAGNEEMF